MGVPYSVHLPEAEGMSGSTCGMTCSLTIIQGREVPGCQHHRMGYYPHVPRGGLVLQSILRVAVLARYVDLTWLRTQSNHTPFVRDVRKLCRTDSHFDYLDVLQER